MSWGLSLSISLINILASFFKWERKYLLLFRIYTKLEQEIWMFIELIGPYAEKYEDDNTHKQQLNLFLTRLETFYKKLNDNLVNIEDSEKKTTPTTTTNPRQTSPQDKSYLQRTSLKNLHLNFEDATSPLSKIVPESIVSPVVTTSSVKPLDESIQVDVPDERHDEISIRPTSLSSTLLSSTISGTLE